MAELVDVTQFYCPKTFGQQGEDNTTHHLVRVRDEMRCSYCGRSQQDLVDIFTGKL